MQTVHICRSLLPELTRPNFISINNLIQNTFHTYATTSVISQQFPILVLTLTKGPAGLEIKPAFTHCSPNIDATSSVGNKRKCCPFIHLHRTVNHSKTEVQLQGCTWQMHKPEWEWQTLLQIMWHYKKIKCCVLPKIYVWPRNMCKVPLPSKSLGGQSNKNGRNSKHFSGNVANLINTHEYNIAV